MVWVILVSSDATKLSILLQIEIARI